MASNTNVKKVMIIDLDAHQVGLHGKILIFSPI
jgi:acetoin utilization deacetylase AcuC-like enzyme